MCGATVIPRSSTFTLTFAMSLDLAVSKVGPEGFFSGLAGLVVLRGADGVLDGMSVGEGRVDSGVVLGATASWLALGEELAVAAGTLGRTSTCELSPFINLCAAKPPRPTPSRPITAVVRMAFRLDLFSFSTVCLLRGVNSVMKTY